MSAPLPVRVLPMRERHLPAVVALEQQVQPHPWTRAMFQAELAGHHTDRRWLIAAVGTELVGFCGLWCSLDEVHIMNIAVAPAWQGRRVGQRLMVEAGRWALQQGASDLTLEVRATNRAAQSLYRKFGLAPVGLRRNYYAESGEDALIMTAADIQQPSWRQRLDDLAAGAGLSPSTEAEEEHGGDGVDRLSTATTDGEEGVTMAEGVHLGAGVGRPLAAPTDRDAMVAGTGTGEGTVTAP